MIWRTRWSSHRVGVVHPGEDIVLVAAFSAHRKAALDACREMMEILKSTAPFWKKETLAQGERWVERKHTRLKLGLPPGDLNRSPGGDPGCIFLWVIAIRKREHVQHRKMPGEFSRLQHVLWIERWRLVQVVHVESAPK